MDFIEIQHPNSSYGFYLSKKVMRTSISFSVLAVLLILPNFLDAQKLSKEFGTFDGVIVSGNIEMVLIADNRNYAEISGKENDIENLEIDMKGSNLRFNVQKDRVFNWFKHSRKIRIELHHNETLVNIKSSASADINSKDVLESSKLTLNSSSGSSLDFEIDCEILTVKVSSGAEIDLTGSTNYQKVNVSSGGRYESAKVSSKEAKAKVSSGGYIAVWADEKLEGNASSGGTINYYGSPISTDVSSSSGGRINSRKSKT